MGVAKPIDVTASQRKLILSLLNKFLPNTAIWAFGSRVKFTSRPTSDLDLVAFIKPEQQEKLADLKDAFVESDLPFKIDIHDWNSLPEKFKQNIQKEYVVLQDAKESMPEKWRTFKIGDLVEMITKGTTPSTLGGRFIEKGINFIKSEAISYDGRIDKSTFVFIDKETHEKLKRSQLRKDDILFSMAGIYLGKNAIVTEDVLPANTNQALAIIRLEQKKATPEFVHYYLSQPDVIKQINSMSGQSAQPNINFEEIKSIEIKLPEINAQKEISSILSSLDNKIEHNLQMNQTLEAIAQAIFKEWFVEFKINGKKLKIDSETLLPKGWRWGKLNEIAKIEIGRTPPRMEQQWFSTNPKDIKWISIRDMGQAGMYIFNTSEYLTQEAKEKFRIPEIPSNTVVLSFKLTVGRIAITTERMMSNEAIAQINSDEFNSAYIYSYLKTYNWDSLGSTSSIATAINSKTIKEMEFLIPDKMISENYSKIVSPIFEKLKVNSIETGTLIQLKDRLLPKLMTGKIAVPA